MICVFPYLLKNLKVVVNRYKVQFMLLTLKYNGEFITIKQQYRS